MVADALREYRRDYKNGDMSRYEFEQVKAQLIKRATPKWN